MRGMAVYVLGAGRFFFFFFFVLAKFSSPPSIVAGTGSARRRRFSTRMQLPEPTPLVAGAAVGSSDPRIYTVGPLVGFYESRNRNANG